MCLKALLYLTYFNDPLLFTLIASVHNFADNNSLSNIAKAIDSLKQTLESERKLALNGFMKTK